MPFPFSIFYFSSQIRQSSRMSGILAGRPAWCRVARGNINEGSGLQPPYQRPGHQPPRGRAHSNDFINCNSNVVGWMKKKINMRVAIDYYCFGFGVDNMEGWLVLAPRIFTVVLPFFPVFHLNSTVDFSFYWAFHETPPTKVHGGVKSSPYANSQFPSNLSLPMKGTNGQLTLCNGGRAF